MRVIDYAIVKRSEVQFQSRWSGTTTPPTPSAPSTSAPSSSTSEVTLEDIMAQLQHMDAHLDTLSDELCQVNTRIGRIARRQAEMGDYTTPSTPMAFTDESNGSNSVDSSDDEDNGDASSPSNDEMST